MSIFTRRRDETDVTTDTTTSGTTATPGTTATSGNTATTGTTDVDAAREARYGTTDRVDHGVEDRSPRHVDEDARAADELTERARGRAIAREEFGGMNAGADLFGWLVAVAVAILLTGVIGAVTAVVAGVNETSDINEVLDRPEGGTISVVSAVVLVLVISVGYYAGGYVAGRMSRFDGARQGLGVWLIGLVVMVIAGVIGAVFGSEYNVLDRVNLPQLPVSDSDASMGALITGAALLLVSLVAALAGGKVGRNYHSKVDAAHLV